MALLEFPLYHGTSTLFLEGIARFGLGGQNPVEQLRVIECAQRLLPIAEARVSDSRVLQAVFSSFQRMAAQTNTGLNFQHGQPYLTPALNTAIRYAVNKEQGSEIITYTLKIIRELIQLGEKEVKETLYQEFSELFALLDIQAAPVLLHVDGVEEDSLLSEKGEPATSTLEYIRKTLIKFPDKGADLCQQENFRLTSSLSSARVTAYLISVRRYHIFAPDYCLLPITLTPLSAPAPNTAAATITNA